MPSPDPFNDARTLLAAAERQHPCCQELETACKSCWLPLLAERVARDWLERYGPTLGDGEAAERQTQQQPQDAHEADETLARRR